MGRGQARRPRRFVLTRARFIIEARVFALIVSSALEAPSAALDGAILGGHCAARGAGLVLRSADQIDSCIDHSFERRTRLTGTRAHRQRV